ncbi:MAG: hypothetical protein ACRED2_07635, partial [Methylocella sp.]
YAKHHRIDVLIGCASLPGVDPHPLALPLSLLHHHAVADEEWRVRPLAGRGVDMAVLDTKAIDARKGIATLPPLLKAYLRAGAKFGDGAVIDAQFGTTDVFTILPLSDLEDRYLNYYAGRWKCRKVTWPEPEGAREHRQGHPLSSIKVQHRRRLRHGVS